MFSKKKRGFSKIVYIDINKKILYTGRGNFGQEGRGIVSCQRK